MLSPLGARPCEPPRRQNRRLALRIQAIRTSMIAMKKIPLTVAMSVLCAAATARAGGPEGVGVGIETTVAGVAGPSINFATPNFHVGGLLAFNDPAGADNTQVTLGGRFFYHVHSTASSDFGVGANLTYVHRPVPALGEIDEVFIEPSFQFRAFVVPNVALSVTGGIVLGAADASGVAFDGALTGGAGVHYYF